MQRFSSGEVGFQYIKVAHTLANWELFLQCFRSMQLQSGKESFSDACSCMLPKHWKNSSQLASVCHTFDMSDRNLATRAFSG